MAKVRCKETNVDSFFGNFLYEQKVSRNHFLRKLNEVVDWSRFTTRLLHYYRGKGEHHDVLGRLYDNLPADWGDMTPSPTYKAMPRGMDDPLTKKYPLFLLTSHSRYRVHYLFWEHPWLRNHVYRHRVWINVADAKARGIKDNDMIMVYNDRGKVVMPAYITSRMMPGTVLIHSGGKVIHDESGVDFGASPSTLLGGDFESCHAPARATNLVQIEKYTEDL